MCGERAVTSDDADHGYFDVSLQRDIRKTLDQFGKMTTRKADYLFHKANQLLEASNFEAAIAAYQEAALLEEPIGGLLPNLRTAWMLSHSKFLDEVSEKYPDSIAPYITKLGFDLENHRPKIVIEQCGLLLDKFSANKHLDLILRGLRLGAAIQFGSGTYILEDSTAVWTKLSSPRGRRKLIEELLSATDTNLIPAFIDLSESDVFPSSVKLLFQKKAELLEALDRVDFKELRG